MVVWNANIAHVLLECYIRRKRNIDGGRKVMKKWMKGFKRAVAVTLAVLMVSDAVDLSALTVAAADQETSGTAITVPRKMWSV